MSKTKQNIIVLMEQPKDAFDISLQAANMCLNTFCIDEEAGFECSGVYQLKEGFVLSKDGNELYVTEYELSNPWIRSIPSQYMYERNEEFFYSWDKIGEDS